MGSGFDDWVYWHFFTITLSYNSSHIELLKDVCLTNLSEESLTNLSEETCSRQLRMLHNQERGDSTNHLVAVTTVKSRRPHWAGHVAGMGNKEYVGRFVEDPW
jgi:hypothetical protein